MSDAPGNPRLADLLSARMILVTGKGGVGKTTVTAALARLAARSGKRVLAAEIGPSPELPSPLLEVLVGPNQKPTLEPHELEPNLRTVLLTPEAGHRAFLKHTLHAGFLADRAMNLEPVRRFLAAAPGFAELGVLYRGLQFIQAKRRDGSHENELVIIDSPATGHALAFASLPGVVLKVIPGGPIGSAVREGLTVLNDPKLTVAVVATLPEALPVSEALELAEGLEKQHLKVHGLVANQVPVDPFDAHERALLESVLEGANIQGGRSLERLQRAAAALKRLRAAAGRAVYAVGERAERGPALVDAVAAALAGAP